MLNVWAFQEQAEDLARQVSARLRAAGIPIVAGPAPTGVLCVSGDCPEVQLAVRRARLDGCGRLVVIVEGQRNPMSVWACLRSGASDVLDESHLETLSERLIRWREVDELVAAPFVSENLVGRSERWLATLRELVEVARFSDTSVLVTGESGTGKELVARLVHAVDVRPRKRELVVLDCTTVQPALAGSEFFGHERGAFTGAHARRDGAFALADHGTLFLDEIGELPAALQAELLRVIQEGTYKPVGSNTWSKTHFRLVCATNRDLRAEVAAGRFRQDLYYRLAAYTCHLAPLRERAADVGLLAAHFLRELRPDVPGFDPLVLEHLRSRPWPGNVRELRQVVSRLATRHVGRGPISVGDLAAEDRPDPDEVGLLLTPGLEAVVRRALDAGLGLEDLAREVKDFAVDWVCEQEDGNLQRAAQRLRVTDRALQQRRKSRQLAPPAK